MKFEFLIRRPMASAAVALMAGIIVGQYTSTMACMIFVAAVFVVSFIIGLKLKTKRICIITIFFIIGIVSIFKANVLEKEYEGESAVNGVVYSTSLTKDRNQIIVVKTKEIYNNNVINDEEKFVYIFLEEGVFVKEGDLLVVKGKLVSPTRPDNPGGFDNFIFMHSKGYDYSMFAESVVKYGEEHHVFRESIAKLRRDVNEVLEMCLPEDISGVAKALVTGDTSAIDSYTRQLYSDAGIAHLLAVSGLHTAILAGIVMMMFTKVFKLNERRASFFVMVGLLIYFPFVGGKTAAARAVIMMETIYFGKIIRYQHDTLNSLGLAAVIILIINPYQLFWVGFMLSFVAVAGIIFITENAEKSENIFQKISSVIRTSFATGAVSFPVISWFFYKVPLFGFVVNIISLPLIGIAVGFGIAAGFAGLISIKLAMFLCGPVYVVLKFYFVVCSFFTSIPFSTLLTGKMPLVLCLLFYFLITLLLMRNKNGFIFRALLTLCLSAIVFILTANRAFLKKTTVDFLYVGQGDSAVINTYDNKTVVIDGGGNASKDIGENTGVNYVIPFLESRGISCVDALFITHMDSDHALGCIEIIKYYNVKKVFISDAETSEKDMLDLVMIEANSKNIPVEKISAGYSAQINADAQIECLYPYAEKIVDDDNNNHTSLVLKANIGNFSFLFTGDADEYDERLIILGEQYVKADVLKAGHHGSKTSSSERFLNEVKPEYAVISCGRNNVYGHPSYEAMERISAAGAEIYSTYLDGDITFITDGNELYIESFLNGR